MLLKYCNIYNDKLNAYQKLCGIRLLRGGVTKRLLNEFNATYDTVNYKTVNVILDRFASQASAELEKWKGLDVVHCGDNVDVRKKARYELAGKSGHDIHMYNNMLYKARTPTSNLSDIPPVPPAIRDVDYTKFIPDELEKQQLLDALSPIIAQSWCAIDDLKSHAEPLTVISPHAYSAEMKQKTEKVSFVPIF